MRGDVKRFKRSGLNPVLPGFLFWILNIVPVIMLCIQCFDIFRVFEYALHKRVPSFTISWIYFFKIPSVDDQRETSQRNSQVTLFLTTDESMHDDMITSIYQVHDAMMMVIVNW